MKFKIEDGVLLALIIAIVGIALWLLSGSPPSNDALIAVALFVAASELMIWRNMFSLDKKTSLGFMKIKNDIEKGFLGVNNRLDKIEDMIKK